MSPTTKRVSAFLIAIIMMAQIAIAHHNVVHLADHSLSHYEHSDESHDDHDQKRNASEECQICLHVKSLSVATIDQDISSFISIAKSQDSFATGNDQISNDSFTSYHSRAPPNPLI